MDIYVGGVPRYDDLADSLMEATDAQAIVLVVVGGNRGHGALERHYVPLTMETRRAIALTLQAMAQNLLDGR